jgi:hypothetical protein
MKAFGKKRLLGFLSIAASVSIVVFLSRYSSRLPDGLESVAGELGLGAGATDGAASSQAAGAAGGILPALLGLMVILVPSLLWMAAGVMKSRRGNER